MDKKSKILFAVFALLIVGSVAVTYWKIMIKKDYIIEAQADCDPYTEKCFLWKCDPSSTVEGEACTDNLDDNNWYFQVVKRNASRIPLCDPNDENCTALVCGENELECEYVFCDETNMEAQSATECNDPVKYTEENPVEEENCDPATDENCDASATECDPETEDCSAVDASTPDATSADTTTVPCDSKTADVCPLSGNTSTVPELE